MKSKMIMVFFIFILANFGFSQNVKVLYKCGDPNAQADSYIKPNIKIKNTGNIVLNLDDLKIFYYYSKDGNAPETFKVLSAKIGRNRVKGVLKKKHLKISFKRAGLLSPGESTGPIRVRIKKGKQSKYNEKNDYFRVNNSTT